MKHHVLTVTEALRRAREELESNRNSPDAAIKRLNDLLDSDEVKRAIDYLVPAEGIPSIVPEQKVDLRVPYPWRSR